MNGEVKMKFNIKSEVDTTRKEIESALKNNEQEKQEVQSYLNKKKNNKVKWDRTKWIISIILLLAGIIFIGVNNGWHIVLLEQDTRSTKMPRFII